MHPDAIKQARDYCAAYPQEPYSVWLELALKRIADLESMIDVFVEGHRWAAEVWKRDERIAPLFADAEKRKAGRQ